MALFPESFEEDQHSKRYTNGTITDDTTNRRIYTWSDTRIGNPQPNWKSLIRQGHNATTPYFCVFRRYGPANVVILGQGTKKIGGDFDEHSISGRLSSTWGDVPTNPSGYPTSVADLAARSKFLSKYRSRRTAFQGGVFLGELMETAKLLSNPARALRQGIERYHGDVKKRLRRSKHPQRTVQDTWLEYVFGWSPLINDIHDIAKIATADPYRVFQPIRATGREVIEGGTDRVSLPGNGLAVSYGTFRTLGYVDVTYMGAIRAENQPPSFPEQLGLSWTNVAPTVWELIPYSFLVDYFTNVGRVIDGISTGNISLAWGCKTTWKQCSQGLEGVAYDLARAISNFGTSYKDISGFATGGGFLGSRTEYSRASVAGVSVGIGDFQFKLPGTSTRWLNIAALARLRK
jgi:hypothetical protein